MDILHDQEITFKNVHSDFIKLRVKLASLAKLHPCESKFRKHLLRVTLFFPEPPTYSIISQFTVGWIDRDSLKPVFFLGSNVFGLTTKLSLNL